MSKENMSKTQKSKKLLSPKAVALSILSVEKES
jgi:hypothetical protein